MNPTKEEISRVMAHLGRRAGGVPKRFTEEELDKRRERMKQVNARRFARALAAGLAGKGGA